jgi:NDP-sugar pyrophosphorylase family protein
MGTADALRAVADHIRGDFICLSSDIISQFHYSDLIHVHRGHAADVTMVLTGAKIEVSESKGNPPIIVIRIGS